MQQKNTFRVTFVIFVLHFLLTCVIIIIIGKKASAADFEGVSYLKNMSLVFSVACFLLLLALCAGCRDAEVEYSGSDFEFMSSKVSSQSSKVTNIEDSPKTQTDGVEFNNSMNVSSSNVSSVLNQINTSSHNEPHINAGDLFEKDDSSSVVTSTPKTDNTASYENVLSENQNSYSSQPQPIVSSQPTDSSDVPDEEQGDVDETSSKTSSRDVGYDDVSGWTPIMP